MVIIHNIHRLSFVPFQGSRYTYIYVLYTDAMTFSVEFWTAFVCCCRLGLTSIWRWSEAMINSKRINDRLFHASHEAIVLMSSKRTWKVSESGIHIQHNFLMVHAEWRTGCRSISLGRQLSQAISFVHLPEWFFALVFFFLE